MSATLRRRCADIPSAGSRCKGTTFFSFLQDIAQKKSPLVFENTNGNLGKILIKRTFFKLAVSGSSLGVLRVVAR